MRIKNGIAYADDTSKVLEVIDAHTLDDHMLWVKFNNSECCKFDFSELTKTEVYSKLKDFKVFNAVDIDHGVVTWDDGNIDIGTMFLYQNGTKIK